MKSEKVINHIVNWLTNYAQKAHSKGFELAFLAA